MFTHQMLYCDHYDATNIHRFKCVNIIKGFKNPSKQNRILTSNINLTFIEQKMKVLRTTLKEL